MTNNHDDDLIPPDPAFPDRPHTLDFARLSSAVSHNDAVADMLDVGAVIDCDMDSLLYLARQRAGMSFGGPQMVKAAHLAIYLDAFSAGVEFERRGGHRADN
jgi:hypothetical protein